MAEASRATESKHPVLVVDDEPTLLRFVTYVLKKAGFPTSTADDAASALAELDAGLRPALAIVDFVLPDLNGAQLVEALLERAPDAAVLLTSGMPRENVAAKLPPSLLPRCGYLEKPFSRDELLAAVAKALA